MTAKQYLKQAYRLNELINSDQLELDNLRSLSTSIASPDLSQDRVQTGHQTDKIGTIVAKIVDLQNQINAEIDRYVDLKKEIIEKVNAVKDDDYRLILQNRYLNFKKWEQIAVDMNITYRWLHTLHNRALNQFEIQHSNSL